MTMVFIPKATISRKSQVLEQSRNHKKDTTRTVGVVQFKLQKPFSEDDQSNPQKAKTKGYWWRNALLFFSRKKWASNDDDPGSVKASRGLVLGPLYMTDAGGSDWTSPGRTIRQSHSSPLAGISTPYISLKEVNMEQQQYRVSTSSLPIYVVT
ncbi:hypothetical protein F3Y22_tig00002841pilonHSYRG00071 [Hibiscus syriacus]|uniref:Uncharacterized protein n=1 Tax=Hibiscus syriacus TaxID=106335 RepID=A0A6A3CNA5_HIBSY|nr:hypothetical protein F3Y22_tig00002841pilonHSYRG00071 [Hibiscus syriacus]